MNQAIVSNNEIGGIRACAVSAGADQSDAAQSQISLAPVIVSAP